LPIPLISAGVSAGDIVRVGLAMDLDTVTDMEVMVMDTEVVDGGALHFIIPQFGEDGMADRDLMAFMEIISQCIIISA
jgi:hypothetical protein